ncbi:hypothetical protein [Natronobacterium gregoryi]|uniref:Uncharacterized protein n=2 Tax=Natronobacterium gregoryi TaxID=44930 RepID=L0ACX6_NATGS|nr:hypothetical protein [Natronobacterium gregoryi]AFZ71748.1 hypothetical protein Natgr_0494 [Natronobacterium gregoryi SP2]ELY72866.1 hypothetical protein C490_02566 [Natronobacterium gregoryi SP2]PLK21070.1 hypothetical protein CYV19_06465 [Natronobacterium gregoryi SP2]SFI88723.1 hypothetical protein SAMN05443661_10876 [Natronobacterium gregoryi]
MSLERFVYANLVLAPLLVVGGYLFWESLPVLVLPLGVGYLTVVALLAFGWVMPRVATAVRSVAARLFG